MIKTTPVQKSDFDQKAFRLLDALNEKGRAEEAWELDIFPVKVESMLPVSVCRVYYRIMMNYGPFQFL